MLPTRKLYFNSNMIGELINGDADTFFVSGQWKPNPGSALDFFLETIIDKEQALVHIGKPDSVLYGVVTERPEATIEIKLTS